MQYTIINLAALQVAYNRLLELNIINKTCTNRKYMILKYIEVIHSCFKIMIIIIIIIIIMV